MFPDPWTFRELANAAKAKLAFDFDRTAALMACWSSKKVNPRSLNPYRSNPVRFTTRDVQSDHKAMVNGGKHIEQTISASQVINV